MYQKCLTFMLWFLHEFSLIGMNSWLSLFLCLHFCLYLHKNNSVQYFFLILLEVVPIGIPLKYFLLVFGTNNRIFQRVVTIIFNILEHWKSILYTISRQSVKFSYFWKVDYYPVSWVPTAHLIHIKYTWHLAKACSIKYVSYK